MAMEEEKNGNKKQNVVLENDERIKGLVGKLLQILVEGRE